MATVLTVIILNSISLVPSKPNGNISFKIQVQITDVSFERAGDQNVPLKCEYRMKLMKANGGRAIECV